ncbi:hypothetical protein AJ79_05879 [Helicocarpus griseus UAMH5409]|uniref:Transcription initiation factor TFIID subunit 8 n=1 Tax=Helicocarpus griseus UAMH5409 TaxID=1447875 RepID=A0A2B7XIM8_9EURO|nr:hypothetical protein AJ79_05879 [Helicocarpus griseus UAMH5409]
MAPLNPPAPSAPSAASPSSPLNLKRSSSPDFKDPAIKRQRRQYPHHHRLQNPLQTNLPDPAITDDASVDTLLNLSISLLLRDNGFSHAEPVALDSFRNGVEEYMLHFLSYIRQSMASCRRMQPLPIDFEHALRNNSLSLDYLRPYLKYPPSTSIQPPPSLLPTPPPEEPTPRTDLPFLGPDLSGTAHRQRATHIPKHFPNFPSRHTYQETPVFTTRETDPRKIREKATEEGRLGEEALRKLARAAKEGQTGLTEQRDKRLWGRKNENMETMFEKTLKGIAKKVAKQQQSIEPEAGLLGFDLGSSEPLRSKTPLVPSKASTKPDLSPIVNCDRVYWRKQTRADVRKVDKKAKDGKTGAG